jgi:ubiquinone biosynthesis protein
MTGRSNAPSVRSCCATAEGAAPHRGRSSSTICSPWCSPTASPCPRRSAPPSGPWPPSRGALLTIDPSFDVVTVARQEGNRLVRSKLKGTKITEELQRRVLQLLPMMDRMPRRINKITEDLEHGRFSMNMRVLETPSDRRFLTSLFQQLIVAVLAGAAVVGAIMLITSSEGPMLTTDIRLYSFFGFFLLFGGFVLSMRSLMLVFRRGVDG